MFCWHKWFYLYVFSKITRYRYCKKCGCVQSFWISWENADLTIKEVKELSNEK